MSESIVVNCDCMEYMHGVPDKAFDLAVVDPPYGIGIDSHREGQKIKLVNGGGGDHSEARRIKPYGAAKSNLANQNFTLRSTIAPRRTRNILGSLSASASNALSGAVITFWIISAARHA